MNRRGHLSTKIPQVKLRPAPAGTSNRKTREASPINKVDEEIMRRALADAEDEESSTAALRRNTKPWKGVIITFTGVDNKPALTALAKELGAMVENALTIHVTHVVAVGFGSAKYLYAVEHLLPVMEPSWIEDAHAQWLNGEELDTELDQENHRLLPFVGLKIAMSGIEPLDRRKQLIKHIQNSGGTYSKDLDRSCTHLISAKPTNEPRSSEKVKWALREIADLGARKRKGVKVDQDEEMKIIYEEWIWDCVAYNGRWKEDFYDARKPRRSGKVVPEDVINGTINLQKEKKTLGESDTTSGGKDPVDNNEPAIMRKRKRESLSTLVTELVSTTGVKADRESPIPPTTKRSSSPQQPRKDEGKPDMNRKPSLLHVSRSTSFATTPLVNPPKPERTTPIPPTAHPQPLEERNKEDEQQQPSKGPKTFFEGLKFSHVIQEQCDGLENAIRQHGGMLVSDEKRKDGERVDYIIVRLCSDVRPDLTENDRDTVVVTECWVEGCCFEERLLSPDKHIVFRPLPAPMPIAGTPKLNVHLSGFSAENNVYMRRLLRAIGGTLSVKLNRQTTHLITVPTTGQKVEKAREWGVKVMKESWLVAMGRSGQLEPEEGHRHKFTPTVAVRAVGKTSDLTANLSTMSDLPDNSDFLLRPPSSKSTSQNMPTISPGRMLKPSPTHIDDPSTMSTSSIRMGGEGGGESRPSVMQTKTIENILSPPKAQTERLLNSATVPPIPPFNTDKMEKEKEKISRTTSAPIQQTESIPLPIMNDSLGERAQSMSSLPLGRPTSIGGTGTEMTEVLRQLAEKDGSTPLKTKVVRRARPSARIKNARSPLNSLSPAASKFSAPPSPKEADPDTSYMGADGTPVSIDGDADIDNDAGAGVGEESVQVRYVDAASARERRKIMALLDHGEGGSSKKAKRK
ncbi:uncharacterized protein IL334_003976 [Kwoniella shivajii]|uniref:BRCT domain-containing protein n=1 Tax=Kwoniella shivajii TaxID=564305 RepID=A0ABZ1D0T4_9TREE|nr:hypothetical protein IL334_003976 [Kwoniella shivajii]